MFFMNSTEVAYSVRPFRAAGIVSFGQRGSAFAHTC